MSTCYPNLPRFTLVDLGSDYMTYLQEIDTQNQSRHYCGEALLEYPSFAEFVEFCRDASFDNGPKPSALMDGIVSLDLPEDDDDFIPMAAVFTLPAFDDLLCDYDHGGSSAPTEAPWDTPFGSFVFASSSKH